MSATIVGYTNIDAEETCPHCGGWKDPEDDICDDCAQDFENDDSEDDGPFENEEDEL